MKKRQIKKNYRSIEISVLSTICDVIPVRLLDDRRLIKELRKKRKKIIYDNLELYTLKFKGGT